jgi:hypothetical protein
MAVTRIDTEQVGFDDRRLLAEGIFENRLDYFHVNAKQIGQSTHIHHIPLLGPERGGRHEFLDEIVCRDPQVLDPFSF